MNNKKELTITRMLNAPRQLVFDAWTQADHLAAWCGPQGFTTISSSADAVPGGLIDIKMQSPEGKVFPMPGKFLELKEPERIVFTSVAMNSDNEEMFQERYTITLEEEIGKTKLTLHVTVAGEQPGSETMLADMEEGWEQSLDKLGSHLMTGGEAAPLIFERTYNVNPEAIWEALTEPEKMKQWYFDIPGFRPEVGFEFSFTGGTEEQQWLHLCKVTDAIPNHKLRHSWRYDGYPGESFVTFELIPEGNKTRLRLTHEGLHTFPAIPELKKANFIGGWTDILGRSLRGFADHTIAHH